MRRADAALAGAADGPAGVLLAIEMLYCQGRAGFLGAMVGVGCVVPTRRARRRHRPPGHNPK